MVVPTEIPSTNISTVEPVSASPVIVGVLSLVGPVTGSIVGAMGAAVSIVISIAVDTGEVFPAASLAVAVML